MWGMKFLILSLFLALPLGAEAPAATEINIEVVAPSPAWKLRVESLHHMADELIVITRASKSDGIFIQQVIPITAEVKVPNALLTLPRQIYILDAPWCADENIKRITNNDLPTILDDSTAIYTAKKEISSDNFIGLSLSEAEAMAKTNNRVLRVVEIDGKPRPMTMDYRLNRFNIYLKEGKVIKVTKG